MFARTGRPAAVHDRQSDV